MKAEELKTLLKENKMNYYSYWTKKKVISISQGTRFITKSRDKDKKGSRKKGSKK